MDSVHSVVKTHSFRDEGAGGGEVWSEENFGFRVMRGKGDPAVVGPVQGNMTGKCGAGAIITQVLFAPAVPNLAGEIAETLEACTGPETFAIGSGDFQAAQGLVHGGRILLVISWREDRVSFRAASIDSHDSSSTACDNCFDAPG